MQTFAGLIDLGFAVFHLAFWRIFNWPERLLPSGRLNSAITQTLNAMLTYVFFVYGGALLIAAWRGEALPALALAAGAGFWALRLVLHFTWFDPRPKAAIAIAVVFFVAALVHGAAAWSDG